MYDEVLGNYSGSRHWNLSFRKSLGQAQSSIEQRCTGVPTAPIGANIYIRAVNCPQSCTERRSVFTIQEKLACHAPLHDCDY